MRYLLDTGILIRIPHRSDPLNTDIRNAIRRLALDGNTFVTTRQNVAEFWNVCTRPASSRGGYGLTTDDTARRCEFWSDLSPSLMSRNQRTRTGKRLSRSTKFSGDKSTTAELLQS